MPFTPLLLAALAAAPLATAPAADASTAPRRLLDRVAAVLDRRPILLSDVELEFRVARIHHSGAGDVERPLSEEELAAALSRAISYRLALAEAERLEVFPPSEEESSRLAKSFAARFPSSASYRSFLKRFEITEVAVAALLQRDLRVERYIDSRVQLRARITDDDVRDRHASRPAAYDGLSPQEARERIRGELVRERYPALVEQLLADLRAKAHIRLAPVFARPPSGALREGAPEGDSQSARP